MLKSVFSLCLVVLFSAVTYAQQVEKPEGYQWYIKTTVAVKSVDSANVVELRKDEKSGILIYAALVLDVTLHDPVCGDAFLNDSLLIRKIAAGSSFSPTAVEVEFGSKSDHPDMFCLQSGGANAQKKLKLKFALVNGIMDGWDKHRTVAYTFPVYDPMKFDATKVLVKANINQKAGTISIEK
jgi:hypothetical protein